MNKFFLFLFSIVLIVGCTTEQDKSKFSDHYNIIWNTPSKDASESMPLVGGDIGCNVWVEDGDLLIYVQRSGSLSENGEYLKMGRFRIQMDPNPFVSGYSFSQELVLEDGNIEIEAGANQNKKVFIKLWVDVFNPVVHIDIESDLKIEVQASYESWRTEDKELLDLPDGSRERFTCFSLEGYPGNVIRIKDEIDFSDKGVLFYHRNPKAKLVPEMLIELQGLENYADEIYDDIENRTFGGLLIGDGFETAGTGEGKYQITDYKSWSIKSEKADNDHQLAIVTHIDQAETIEIWKNDLSDASDRVFASVESKLEKTQKWWNEFWERSHIIIYPDDPDPDDPAWQMGRNYQLFRYQLGGNFKGEYPTKFNGGNLIYDPVLVNASSRYEPDWRQWGGAVHTAQNQRLLYWPMLKAGDFDAIIPQFELYRKGLPGATARVKEHFGHEGAVFPEYMSAPGIVFGAGWGWEGSGHRGRGEEIPFGDPRANGARGYNDLAEKGVMANQSCQYHWESQVEHAYMILEYHRFSGEDISGYLPFIKSSVIFFDEHYRLRQKMRNGKELDENGKLVIFPSTSCESYRGAKNPADLISGLRACLHSIVELEEAYVSEEEKKYFKEFLGRVPEYSRDEKDGLDYIQPAESWIREANQELPQFYPLFPFNQFKIGDEEIELFKNSYELAPAFRKGTIKSWHQDGIQFARMGMADEAMDYNTRKLKDSPRRFPTFWGPGHDWVPDHNWGGSGMIGLQEQLMQTIGDKIVILPAWPRNHDVDFKLHAPGNTRVECILKNGEITKLAVTPESRKDDVVLPDWGDSKPELLNPLNDLYIKKYLNNTKPRLVYTPRQVEDLKQKIQKDRLIGNYYEAIRIQAYELIDEPLLEREKIGRRLLSVSREMLNRINKLGLVYLIESDDEILDRIDIEILAVCNFSDWNPSHYLDVAEMSMAVALGLDWTQGNLPESTIRIAKNALIDMGLHPSWPEFGGRNQWWVNGNNNWNQVCHGGMIAASIVIAEDDPELAAKTISRALDYMPHALEEYMPDGVYPEGPTYWGYGTSFTVITIEMLRSAFGTDFGMKRFPGFMESAEFVTMTKAPSGLYYNFADCGDRPGKSGDITLAWFAAESGISNYFDKDLFLGPPENMSLNRLSGAALSWMARYEEKESVSLYDNWFGYGTNPIAIISDRNSDRGFYLGAKGGAGIINHGNMDGGSFIFELDGVRWVVDPGVQPYHELEKTGFNLWSSCQTCDRWKLLTKNNFGHSTLTINGELHVVDGQAEMIETIMGESPGVVFDMSKAFGDLVLEAKRSFTKENETSLLISDLVKPSGKTKTITWQLITQAKVEIKNGDAVLKQGGKELLIRNISYPDIPFEVISLDPPPFELDKKIQNLKRLELKIPASDSENNIEIEIRLTETG